MLPSEERDKTMNRADAGYGGTYRAIAAALAAVGCLMVGTSSVHAVNRPWVDWTSSGPGTATGNAAGITVNYVGETNPAAQTSGGGTNYWARNSSTYTDPPIIDNPPPDSDIIRLSGGPNTGLFSLTFSQPVKDPIMAIMSMGQGGIAVQYDFDAPFDILNNGLGHFGNGPLTELAGDILEGREGHGIIQFDGTFTSINWTVPTFEFWHGFTVALPEPASASLLGVGLLALGRRAKRA